VTRIDAKTNKTDKKRQTEKRIIVHNKNNINININININNNNNNNNGVV